MDVEKFCVKCLHEVFCDTTEHHWCCECFATRTIQTGEFDFDLEYIPPHWIETASIPQMIDEFRALREICGMYCEQLPVEVREVLHAIPEIEKTHKHSTDNEAGQQLTRDQMPWFRGNMK